MLTMEHILVAKEALNKLHEPKEKSLLMSEATLELYDEVRPWRSIHEHITNTKFSSDGSKYLGARIHKVTFNYEGE